MAENNGIKLLSYYLQKLKSFFLSKDILSFSLFFVLSAGFWFVHALGKEREKDIAIPVRYVGIPPYIAITNNPPTEIFLSVKDQGMRLLDYSKSHINPLTIDLSRIFYQKGEIVITADQLSGRISRYLQTTTSILEIHPDSILIQYEKLNSKTLPIELMANIELEHQHIFSDKIQIEPSQVTVFGPKRIIDSLKTVRTEVLKVFNISDTNSFICKLKPIRLVRFSAKDIKATIYVEQFTEKKVQIPITALNCPDNLNIRTFPTIADVTYTVGLSHFNSVSSNEIQVFLDYNDLKNTKMSKQKLKFKCNSSFISNVRILPLEVEFLLEQK